jgi:hypothetical protein
LTIKGTLTLVATQIDLGALGALGALEALEALGSLGKLGRLGRLGSLGKVLSNFQFSIFHFQFSMRIFAAKQPTTI